MSIYPLKRPRPALGLAALILVSVSLACSLPFMGGQATSTPTPAAPTSTPVLTVADYGDAPDGDQGMEAGYYAPAGGPYLFTYNATGIAGNFPTMGEDSIPGPYTLDVDEFWIGPLFGRSGSGDIPSLEDDADDPNDPDGVANLLINAGGADCDQENGSHNPSGNGCASQPAYSLPMNARLSIMFGQPPLGIWITSVTASETMGYTGPVYWNLLFDLNQDGDWDGPGEWIAQDVMVDLEPGETETLISPAFRFPTSGSPWGRLNFPYWVRSMVTSESVADAVGMGDWDGRGPENGFAVGEVEDYFVEWQPIGQKRQGGGGAAAGGNGADGTEGGGDGNGSVIGSGTGAPGSPLCAPLNARELELLPTVNRDLAEIARLQPGIEVEKVTVFAQSGVDGSIPVERVGDLEINPGAELNGTVTGGVINLIMTEFSLDLEVNPTGDKMLRVLLLPEGERSGDCSGNVPVEVGPAFYREFPPPLTEVDTIFGDYLTDSRYDSGDESHGPFAQGDQIGSVNAAAGPGGGVIFSGPPPFVTVEGLLDQNSGSFSTEGVGVVAGFPDITVKFDGRLTLEEGLNGLYEMGADGGLPGGESITYRIEGQLSPEEILQATTMPQVGPPPLDPGLEGAILDFVDVFNTSFENGSADDLFRLLHPAVFDIYGAEQCQVYLEGVVETPTSLEFNSGLYFGDWSFERDGVSRPVEDAYLVDVTLTANGQTVPQTQHLSLPGDDSVRWFTDCGEPLELQ